MEANHESLPMEHFLPPFLSDAGANGLDVFAKMARNVNNHLKTPEQIELEISEEIIDNHIRKTDGYINIHSSDEILSGHMEENY